MVFAGVGDRISVEPASCLSLSLSGPFSDGLSAGGDNLVLRAAEALAANCALGAAIHLEKNLPLASGIGGGSSDAATTLALLSKLWNMPLPEELAAHLGADVPVCCAGPRPLRMRGIGDLLTPVPDMPSCWIVLVNPMIGVPTGAVFAGVRDKNPPAPPEPPNDGWRDFNDLVFWLATQRNDLQFAATAACPVITNVLEALGSAPLARMSGSGATCFALMPDETSAMALADQVRNGSAWWVAAAPVLD